MAYEWINHLLIGMHIQSPKTHLTTWSEGQPSFVGTRQSRQRTLPILFETGRAPIQTKMGWTNWPSFDSIMI
jgi:hypothetical protein